MGKYDNIINLPHHISTSHPRMSNQDRAAQFSPFAALTGYETMIDEVTKTYEKKKTISKDQSNIIEKRLNFIMSNIDKQVKVEITYFKREKEKNLGHYHFISGTINRIDTNKMMVYINEMQIKITDIYLIESNEFDKEF